MLPSCKSDCPSFRYISRDLRTTLNHSMPCPGRYDTAWKQNHSLAQDYIECFSETVDMSHRTFLVHGQKQQPRRCSSISLLKIMEHCTVFICADWPITFIILSFVSEYDVSDLTCCFSSLKSLYYACILRENCLRILPIQRRRGRNSF